MEFTDGIGRTIVDAIHDEGAELRKFLNQQMNQSVKVIEVFDRRDEARNSLLEDIKAALESLTDLQGETTKAQRETNTAVDLLKDIEKNNGKGVEKAFTPENINRMAQRVSTEQNRPPKVEPNIIIPVMIANKELDVNVSGMAKDAAATLAINLEDLKPSESRVGDETKVVIDQAIEGDTERTAKLGRGGILGSATAENAALRNFRTLGLGIASTTAAVAGGIQATDVFKGLIGEELKFSKELGRAAYTQRGITADQKAQLDAFKQFSREAEIAAITGKTLADNYKTQLRMIKRGVVEEKQFADLSAMVTSDATALNVESEQLVDYYGDLSIILKMTNAQIARMGYRMKAFAKQTGISGEMLVEAAKSTEEIRMNLMKSGSATPENVQGYVQMIATAMQQGAPHLGKSLGDSMSKTFVQRMKDGVTNDPATMMQIRSAGGDGAMIQRILGGATTPEDTQKIMQDQMLQVSEALGGAVPDQKKFFGPIWDEVTKMRSGGELTAEEAGKVAEFYDRNIVGRLKAFGMSQEEINRTSMMINKSIAMGQYELGEAGKQFKTMNSRATQMISEIDTIATLAGAGLSDVDFQADVKNMNLGKKVEDIVKNLNEELANKGLDRFKIDPKQIDDALKSQKSYDVLFEGINKANQALTVAGAMGTSVLSELQQKINVVGETIRDMISGPLEWLGEKIGATGLLFIGLGASMAAAIAAIAYAVLPLLRYGSGTGVGKALLGGIGSTKVGAKIGEVGKKVSEVGVGKTISSIGHMTIMKPIQNVTEAGKEFGKTMYDVNTHLVKNSKSVGWLKTFGDKIGTRTKGLFDNLLVGMRGSFDNLSTGIGSIITTKFPGLRKAFFSMVLLLGSYITSFKDSLMGLSQLGGLKGIGSKIAEKALIVKGRAGAGLAAVGTRIAESKVGQKIAGSAVGKGASAFGKFVASEAGVFARAAKIFGSGTLTATKALTSWTGVIPLAIALGEGLAGALSAGENAMELFGVKAEELTTSQHAAAEGAGFLTGILNGLTFGIFNKWIGSSGTWTKAIAQFLDAFWPLNVVLQAILIPLKVLWGALKGLWTIFETVAVSLWEGLKEGLEPLGEVWATFNEILSAMFPTLQGGMKGWTDIVKVVADFIGMAAKPLGFVFKWLGKTLGWVITVIGTVVTAIMGLIAAFVWVVDKIGGFIGAIVGAFLSPIETMKNMAESIMGWFTWLWDELVGHSIIPDLIMGIIKFFAMLPLKIPGLLFDAFMGIGSIIADAALGGFESVGTYLWDSVVSPLANLGTWMWENITTGLASIKDWILSWIPGMGNVQAATEGFTQTTDDFTKAAAEGPSVAHGLGGVASIVQGDVGKAWEGTKEVGSAAWEGTKDLTSSAWEGTKAVASYINPLNWFKDGTREIQQGGLGVLHEGEMVVPRTIWDQIKAVGDGAFGPISGFGSDMFEKAANSAAEFISGIDPVGMLQKVATAIMEPSDAAEIRTLPTGSISAEDRIRREKEEASTSKVEVVNAGMDELTALNSRQTDHLASIKEGIEKLVAALTASGTVGHAGNSADRTASYATGNAKVNDYFESPFAYGNNYLTHQTIVQTGVG